MLKRAGTVASGVTVGLLALSPLAYAGSGGHFDHDDRNYEKQFNKTVHQEFEDENENENALVSADNNNVQVPVQACNNNVPVNVLGIQVPVQDIAAALGFEVEGTDAENNDSCRQAANQAQVQENEAEGNELELAR